ncbi:MAG: hypothetical protein ACNA8L_10245 [Luteolibacter sp.]
MKRRLKRAHRVGGQSLAGKSLRIGGGKIARILYRGGEIWPNAGVTSDQINALFPSTQRIILEDGRKWFEFGFYSPDILQGDGEDGFSDEDGYIFAYPQYSEDLVAWSNTGFLPSTTPPQFVPGKGWLHWCRAKLPTNADPKNGVLAVFSNDSNGDPRNNPFTAIIIGGTALALPNYAYTMPTDAAQLQTDIRAAGYPDATVAATSDVDWQINIPDVDIFGFQDNSRVLWPSYLIPDIGLGGDAIISGRSFVGTFVDIDGSRVVTKGFARLGIVPGARYGTVAAPIPIKNPAFVDLAPLVPPPIPGDFVPPPTSSPAAPYLLLGSANISIDGSRLPGATLTAPTLNWINPDDSEMTVVGTWYKNGEPTNEHGPTYDSTDDGDLIEYREIATNGIGPSTQTIFWPKFAVSVAAVTHVAEAHAELAPLIVDKAGDPAMNIFTAFDHAGQTYTRNVNLWAAPLVDQLAACVSWKTRPRESYGGVLITPRHVLYCNHAHPHAEGTWIYPHGPQTVRFVRPDNTVINSIQLCQTDYNSTKPGYINPASYTPANLDLCVATLDRDMTADHGIHPIPFPLIRRPEEWLAFLEGGVPRIAVSQGVGRPTNSIPPTPISDYPQYHQAMAYIRTPGSNPQGASPPYDHLDYRVWDGDSGTPTFLLHRGQLYLEGILVSTPWGRVPAPIHVARLNQMIAASDAGAVTLGRLPEPTGLTITPVPIPTD